MSGPPRRASSVWRCGFTQHSGVSALLKGVAPTLHETPCMPCTSWAMWATITHATCSLHRCCPCSARAARCHHHTVCSGTLRSAAWSAKCWRLCTTTIVVLSARVLQATFNRCLLAVHRQVQNKHCQDISNPASTATDNLLFMHTRGNFPLHLRTSAEAAASQSHGSRGDAQRSAP